jgi:hypothetical protein
MESRILLTSTLYLDYGDRWPGGVLNTTVGAIDDTTNGSNPNIDGPRLTDTGNNNYADGTTVAITSVNNLQGTNAANVRSAMTALARRFYEPFDITVVELTANFQNVNGFNVRGAANLNEVSATLGVNEGVAENNDTYLLIGAYLINGVDNPNSNAFGTNAYGGLSTGTDINNNNNNDGTALVIFGGNGNITFDGPQEAHEAGHAFGLEHIYRQNTNAAPTNPSNTTATGAQYDMLHQSELMSYLGYNSQGGFNFFSRFPTMDGDGNTDANSLGDAPTPYDDLIDDPQIGPSGIEYVTGTGAHDIITITKTGATTANVSVQAFFDAGYTTSIDFPGPTGNTYSYSINTDRPLTIDAGGNNDRITIDGDLGNTITLRGMHGTDELIVMGKNAASATYTTGTNSANGIDGNSDLRGSVQVGLTMINFLEFEAASKVTVQDVGTLTVRTGGAVDSLTLDDAPTAGRNRVTGTSDGVTVVPLDFFNVTKVLFDTATNDGAGGGDNVTVQSAAPATNLNSIDVDTGNGSDLLTVDFDSGNPIPAGGLNYDAGAAPNNDRLKLRGGSFTNVTYTPSGPHSGNVDLDGTDINYANLAPIDDIVTATNAIVNGTAGGETINVVNGTAVEGVSTIQVNSPAFELVNLGRKTNVVVNGQGGGDTIDLSATSAPSGLSTLTANGDDANDVINVNNTAIATTVNGGAGGDTVNITGSGLAAGTSIVANGGANDDVFNVTSSANIPVTINGDANDPGDGDVLHVDGESLDYTINAASFTTAGRQPVNFATVETLAVTNGTFNVPGTVGTNLRINTGATVYGTGNVQGRVTGNTGGTLSPGTSVGASPGTLNAGGLTLNAGSTYDVNLNGLADADHDQVKVTGTVALNNGNLTGSIGGGYTSIPGDEITIIRNDLADAVAGQFAGLGVGSTVTISGQKFAVDYAFDADGDLGFNDVALIRYGAALAPDPCDPTKMALYVSATTGNDEIRVIPVTGNSRARVLINGNDEGEFDFSGLIIVMGQAGNDLISIEMPARKALLYGGVGNDTIRTGNQDSVLVGGFGNDTLYGNNGKDILIGGAGADRLEGGNGGDALIAGNSAYDSTQAPARKVLCAVLDDWARSGKDFDSVLNASTLFDDADIDLLLGQQGNDLFWVNKTGGSAIDQSDAVKNEQVFDLT